MRWCSWSRPASHNKRRSRVHSPARSARCAVISSPIGIVKLPALVFNGRMNMPTIQPLSYSGYRFPAVIISHCTWLYFRFALGYRDVAEMMAERGVTVSYETIREWSQKFGGMYAKRMRSKRHRLGDRWHLDEVFLTINGKLQYLWRAVASAAARRFISRKPRTARKPRRARSIQ